MKKGMLLIAFTVLVCAGPAGAGETFETDVLPTSHGDLKITFIGHASLMFQIGGKVIYNDPAGQYGDYGGLPKADLILVAHEHGDHFDPKVIAQLSTDKTKVVLTSLSAAKGGRGIVLKNGEETTVDGILIKAVPAYNIAHMRSPGMPYHPKGDGNGYILTFGDKRVYVAGDTENIPEMKGFGRIDVAFLPMNLPYTMTPEMAADAARMVKPQILYPYHTGETDTAKIVALLKGEKGIEVRIRKMK
ncbi:MAG: MBL fold metallo-hydrolase [Proteobacteria bacterium]|nr:MBL fold metallo-hydrolase [Pseudomonadota bacterium]MBU3932504.1 MBL fold metallo-hydrolase [Pseudomonadota bacterium]